MDASINDFPAMSFNDLADSIAINWIAADQQNRKPPCAFVLGAPGGGKSALARSIEKVCAARHLVFDDVVEINPSFFDPTDMLGTPWRVDNVTDWAPPRWMLNRLTKGKVLLNIEEGTDCEMLMQNLLARIINDNNLNEVVFGNLFIIVTGNRSSDKSGASRLSTKLGNRVLTYAFKTEYEQWRAWYIRDPRRDPLVTAFLAKNTDLLHAFDPNSQGVCPTPRSWEKVGYMPRSLFRTEEQWLCNVQGAVGRSAAVAYATFCRFASKLPDLNEIKRSPSSAPVPTELEVLYILSGAIGRDATDKNADAYMTYLYRLRKEFRLLAISDAVRNSMGTPTDVTLSKSVSDWMGGEGLEVNLASTY